MKGATTGGVTFYHALISGIQNGAPDGVAMDVSGEVVQFLSYEARRVIANKHLTDVGFRPTGSVLGSDQPGPCICMSIHPEGIGRSCSHLASSACSP